MMADDGKPVAELSAKLVSIATAVSVGASAMRRHEAAAAAREETTVLKPSV